MNDKRKIKLLLVAALISLLLCFVAFEITKSTIPPQQNLVGGTTPTPAPDYWTTPMPTEPPWDQYISPTPSPTPMPTPELPRYLGLSTRTSFAWIGEEVFFTVTSSLPNIEVQVYWSLQGSQQEPTINSAPRSYDLLSNQIEIQPVITPPGFGMTTVQIGDIDFESDGFYEGYFSVIQDTPGTYDFTAHYFTASSDTVSVMYGTIV